MTQRVGCVYRCSRSWTGTYPLWAVAFSVALLLPVLGLKAQVVNGINGTLTDTSGGVIVGAHVSATNTATEVVSSAVTSSDGTFTIVGLIPGQYSVAVDVAGFKRVQTTVTVEIAKMSTLNLQMEPGSTSQSVEVKASAISLETTSPEIGTTLEPELVKTAPIEINSLTRQIDSFMYLAPGVQGNASAHYINGGVTFENEVQFNGIPVAFVDYEGNQTYINPPYEMVNEFRVNSSTFDARYGLGQGSVTYSMASGANQLHGDGFDILRNQWFDSVGFFPTRFNSSGQPLIPVDQQNDYGFTVGGPVYLPKIYNGRNRTFFHFSSDWFRQNQSQSAIGTVPTAAMKQGDFSDFVGSNGVQIPIYDPQTGQPFPNNMIPTARFSALSNSILPHIPAPNRAGLVSGLVDNESPAVSSVAISQNLWGYTLDHNLSSTQTLHFSQWRDVVNSPSFTSAPIVPSTNELQSEETNENLGSGFLLNYVNTLTPRLVVTAGMDWIGLITGIKDALPNVHFSGISGGTTFPLISFGGPNAPTAWGVNSGAFEGGESGALTTDNNRRLGIVLVNNWLWTKGRNTFNFGGEVRRTYQDIIDCAYCGGTYSFDNLLTTVPNPNDPNFGSYGSPFASFLLGEPNGAERIFSSLLKLRNKAFATYVQDDIKVSKRLTVNAGIRWDIMVPFTESQNEVVYADTNLPDPGAGNLLGGATEFGHCELCAGITRLDIHLPRFGPRLGFAYMLNSKTVVRSSYYLSFLDGGAYEYGTAQAALFYSTVLQGGFDAYPSSTNVPAYGGWDTQTLPAPALVALSREIGHTLTLPTLDAQTDGTAPYVQAWNAGIQRQLPWNMFLSVAYVGNRAIRLPGTLHLNDQLNPVELKYGSLLGESVTSPDAIAAGIQIPYPTFVSEFGGGATVEQALRPFPQYHQVFDMYEHDGLARYNAMQMELEKRFSNGVSFLEDLTLGRLNANVDTGSSAFAPNGLWNPVTGNKADYGPSPLDQEYVQNLTATYRLPIGPGQKFLDSKGVLGRVLGGWQISGIATYAGGFAFGPLEGFNPVHVGTDRPNQVPGVTIKTFNYNLSKPYLLGGTSQAPPLQFTTNAFSTTGPWQIGNAVANYAGLRTPPLRIENFSLSKSFYFTERVRGIVRLDYFNAFNRTQLQGPDNQILDSTFGQITNLSSQISNRQGEANFRLEF